MPGPGSGPGPRGDAMAQKEKASFSSFMKIIRFAKKYYPMIIIATILAIGGSIITIIGPDIISDLTNDIYAGVTTGVMDLDSISKTCINLLILYSVGAVLSYGEQLIMAHVTQSVSKELRTNIDQKINRLPLAYFDGNSTGDILSRVTNDVDLIAQTLGSSIANLVSAITLFVGVVIMMFVSNWILALTTIIASVLGFIVTSILVSHSQKYFDRKQDILGDMNGEIEEMYTNHDVANSYNATEGVIADFNKLNDDMYVANTRSQFLSGCMQPVMSFTGNFSYIAVFAIGIGLIVNNSGSMTFGTIMSFVIYAKLFSQPLSTFAQSLTSIQQASAASKRVFDLLEETELSDESEKTATIENNQGNVVFDHVKFSYVPEKPLIKDFNFEVTSGQKVAIVGPTGAGKTTLVNLLMRFYEINSGNIYIDGVSIQDMKREDVRDQFDMILQDTWLFKGTVRENLVYNKKDVSDEEVEQACKTVGLSHFVNTLEHGYDTVLDENCSLSEGQKQQLTIARAIIKNSPLLILDEATSNVDTRTELKIQKAMDELTKGRTSFVIAHRLSTIKDADVILVVNDGDIIETGTHEELLKKNGFYAELYNSQFAV